MNNDLYRIGKIAISQKLPDRFLSVKVYSPKGEEKEYGSLYFLIEITTPWFPATEIGKAIEKSIISNFYSAQNNKNTEARFEEALKKTNLVLGELAKKGDTNWIGNLNAIIAAVAGDEIYITGTGKSLAFLLREKSLKNIYQKEQTPHSPINSFTNVISGSLEAGDKIVLTNEELLNQIHREHIQTIIQSFDPITAIHEIAKILRKKKVTNVNSLILEFVAQDKIAFQPPSDLTDTVFLDRAQDQWIDKTLKKTKPIIAGTREKLKTGLKDTKEKTAPVFRKFTIAIGKTILAVGDGIKSLFGGFTKTRREKARDKIKTGKVKEWEDFIDKPKQRSFFQTIIDSIGKVFSFLGMQIILLFTKRRKLLIIIILAILLIWGINIIRKRLSEPRLNVNQIIQEAEAKESQAKSELAVNNKDKARNLFLEALGILDQVKEDEKAQDVYNRIQGKADEMDIIIRWDKTDPIFNFSAHDSNPQIAKIIFYDKNLYAANKNNNKIYQISETDFAIKNTAQIPTENGQIQMATPYSNSILWKTNSKNLYSLNLNSMSLQKENTSSGDWKNGLGLSYYYGNIYFLVPLENQIYKYTKISTGWSEAKDAIDNTKTDISKAVSFDIDGYIYVLNQDGGCLKLSKGSPLLDFSLKNIPPPAEKIESPKTIITSTDLSSLYILDADAKRILEFDKEGNYLRQYIAPDDIGQIKDIAINTKTQKMYVLADAFVYQFGL